MPDLGRIVGCDQSLRCTSLHDGSSRVQIPTGPNDFGTDAKRIVFIRNKFLDAVSFSGIVFFEGLAFSRNMAYAKATAGLSFVLRIAALESAKNVYEVPPNVLKKYVTGKGSAPKDAMRMCLMKKPWEHESLDNNDADAYALQAFGNEYVSWVEGAEFPKYKIELFRKVQCET